MLTRTLSRSGRNIAGCEVTFANLLNVYDVLHADKLVVDQAALAKDRGGIRVMKNALRYHQKTRYHRAVHGGCR